MGMGKKITEKAFFIIIFVLLSAIGIANAFGISGNDILTTLITAVIASAISMLVSFLVFHSEGEKR